jgi:hypothetical protein
LGTGERTVSVHISGISAKIRVDRRGDPVPPEPSLWLQIGTDPTPWVLEGTDYDSLAAELAGATGPVVLPVVSPLQGRLVLSVRNAGTFSLLGSPSVGGPHPVGDPTRVGGPHPVGGSPSGGHGPHPVGHSLASGQPLTAGGTPGAQTTPVVYLPSVTAANPGSPVNVLDPGTDLAAVEQDIIDAMSRGAPLTLSVVQRDIIDSADVIDAIDRGAELTPQISARSGRGVLVLNGAALAFAVLAQVAT